MNLIFYTHAQHLQMCLKRVQREMNLTESNILDRHFRRRILLLRSTYLGRNFVQNSSCCAVSVILRTSYDDLRLGRCRLGLARCRWWRRRVERSLPRSGRGGSFTASELLSGTRWSRLMSRPISVTACRMSSCVRLVGVVPRALSGLTPRVALRASPWSPVLSGIPTWVPDLNVGRFREGGVAWSTLNLTFL